ncbi:glutamic acid-rich protein-like [Ochlerotatus camptorhynchus]|uniref:glutamic acid-rich protein-like n=1 Tax=Ochlerotatus camptorhynchus TaxID=644619 RepID=UPI0031DD4945
MVSKGDLGGSVETGREAVMIAGGPADPGRDTAMVDARVSLPIILALNGDEGSPGGISGADRLPGGQRQATSAGIAVADRELQEWKRRAEAAEKALFEAKENAKLAEAQETPKGPTNPRLEKRDRETPGDKEDPKNTRTTNTGTMSKKMEKKVIGVKSKTRRRRGKKLKEEEQRTKEQKKKEVKGKKHEEEEKKKKKKKEERKKEVKKKEFFNAGAVDWGSRCTNARGYSLLEALAKLDVSLANEGTISTFRKDGRESIIDENESKQVEVEDEGIRQGSLCRSSPGRQTRPRPKRGRIDRIVNEGMRHNHAEEIGAKEQTAPSLLVERGT